MRIEPLAIADVLLIHLDRFEDERGWFVERYHEEKLAALGFDVHFVQDNHSRSHPGVLRGIHFQNDPEQGKLVGVTHGVIYDVAVDLRPASVSFGQHVGVELDAESPKLLWVPPGFGHGFCVIGGTQADVTYKVSGRYNPQGEGGIRYDDPDLAIRWPVEATTISARDRALPYFKDHQKKVNA